MEKIIIRCAAPNAPKIINRKDSLAKKGSLQNDNFLDFSALKQGKVI